jgi:hypothetical protein
MPDLLKIDSYTRPELVDAINELLLNNFDKLVHILYRLDISEQKLKQSLQHTNEASAEIIADMIIKRQQQKAELRKKFKQEGEGER